MTAGNRSAEYDAYLRSPEWQVKREATLNRDGHRCRLCNRAGGLHVHHRTYARLYSEDLNDLTTLCGGCHKRFHSRTYVDSGNRNWSTIEPAEQREVEMRCLRWIWHFGEATTKAVATDLDERTQLVGQCFVVLRRRRWIRRCDGKRWKITHAGIEAAKTAERVAKAVA